MALEDDITVLKGISLFSRVPDEPLRLLAFGASRIRRRKGQRLFTAGAPAFTAYIVLDGAVALVTPDDTDNAPEALLGPGTLIGEYALLCESTRSQTAVMAEEGTLLEIPRLLMRRVLEEYPRVAEDLLDEMIARIAATSAELEGVRERLLALDGEARTEPPG